MNEKIISYSLSKSLSVTGFSSVTKNEICEFIKSSFEYVDSQGRGYLTFKEFPLFAEKMSEQIKVGYDELLERFQCSGIDTNVLEVFTLEDILRSSIYIINKHFRNKINQMST